MHRAQRQIDHKHKQRLAQQLRPISSIPTSLLLLLLHSALDHVDAVIHAVDDVLHRAAAELWARVGVGALVCCWVDHA
eukprot:CAMPEP_0185853584 /NCGR_PEP_ID=MMETSP1354-20130828/19527_1 /TAXON_ID=708628 /ORGANISM="Erythrolobus madagascarensis, Strain CCMP3276" /LENGTH=77 /DNA_ID=CAMNT_0028555109 /DNA_START=71 /DNA_END=300 /DNA_ORIENTATION=+